MKLHKENQNDLTIADQQALSQTIVELSDQEIENIVGGCDSHGDQSYSYGHQGGCNNHGYGYGHQGGYSSHGHHGCNGGLVPFLLGGLTGR